MGDKKYHLANQPIPTGFRIYEDRLDVMGVVQRRADALAFVRGKRHSLELQLEPGNSADPNAIQVIGNWAGWLLKHSKVIGYVPREAAKRLADAQVNHLVAARLLKTYAGADGFVEVQFQIVGPTEAYGRYAELSPSVIAKAKAKVTAGAPDEAEALLLAAVNSTERQSQAQGLGVAPRPYLDLAKLYRKAKRREDEIAILERYERQKKAPGRLPEELAERLAKLRDA